MGKLVLEVGMKLDNSLMYYHDMLLNHGLKLDMSFITHDVYYTKNNLDGLSENEMKKSCERIRYVERLNHKIRNDRKLKKYEDKLIKEGYIKVFDTIKFDFQYCNKSMKIKVQLQDIKDIGLLVYYDNPDYYEYPLDEQRKMLLDELNSYGFNFIESDLGIDKLRILYYGKEMFSLNQNA